MVIICFLALLNFSLSGAISSDVPTQLLKYDEFVSTNIRPNHILYSYKQFYWDFRSLISTDKNYYVYRLIDASKDLEFKKTNKLCISMNDCEDRLGLQVLINSLINYTKRSNDFLIYDLNKLSMVFDLLYLTNYSTSKPNNNEIDYLVAEALVNNDIEKFNNQSNSLKDSPLIEQSFNLNDSVISKDLELIYVAKFWSNNTSERFFMVLKELYFFHLDNLSELKKKYNLNEKCALVFNQSKVLEVSNRDYYLTLAVCQNYNNIGRLTKEAENNFLYAESLHSNGSYKESLNYMIHAISEIKKAKMLITDPIEFINISIDNMTRIVDPGPSQVPDYIDGREGLTNPQTDEVPALIDKHSKENQDATLPLKKSSKDNCVIAGCSGEICIDKDEYEKNPVMSICLWREEYRCLYYSICEKQSNGKCGWTKTQEYLNCMAQNYK